MNSSILPVNPGDDVETSAVSTSTAGGAAPAAATADTLNAPTLPPPSIEFGPMIDSLRTVFMEEPGATAYQFLRSAQPSTYDAFRQWLGDLNASVKKVSAVAGKLDEKVQEDEEDEGDDDLADSSFARDGESGISIEEKTGALAALKARKRRLRLNRAEFAEFKRLLKSAQGVADGFQSNKVD
jgi:hypothetical protein